MSVHRKVILDQRPLPLPTSHILEEEENHVLEKKRKNMLLVSYTITHKTMINE